ncbi:regulatory protein RecX [Leucobacter chromiireducens]|uniref:Regulatory protein RecX n=1 Tax=Leucobacter chromiireducens subsp. solipictus TaxID=398235 RepID=A0ABS1SCA2_9MICO|nr:regulatory protein RecX [Leucobacter chromiireducens]MBL3678174.1 regulatory protein RecX [Leucobacter chromiireducens subsp. solipictus]
MAVRFLPPPGASEPGGGPDREDLAEVIQLRGKLPQRPWGGSAEELGRGVPMGSWAEPAGEAEPADEAESADDAEAEAEVEAEAPAEAWAESPPEESAPVAAVVTALHDRLVPASALRAPAGTVQAREESSVSEAPEPRPVYDDGVKLLARRARSSGELREELLRLEHSAHEVDVLIEEFRESHYLDDLGLARSVVEKLRTTKRASRSQIGIKLRERRLPDAVIDEALGELDADEEFSLLRDAAVARASKLGGLERHVAERRLLGFLARRGWSGEAASRIAREALDGTARGSSGSGRSGSGVRFH